MQSRKFLYRVIVSMIIAIVFVLAGFIATTWCEEKNEILFGATLSLTGMFGGFGKENQIVYSMGVEDINKDGGIYVKEFGKKLPVRLIYYDDASEISNATSNYDKLIRGDKVDLLLGQIGGVNDVTAPVADKYNVPWVGVVYARKTIKMGLKWVVSPFHTGDDEAYAFFNGMRTLPKDKQPKTVALFEELSPDGDENARGCETMASKFGFKIVLHEKYTPGADPTSFLLKCKKQNVDIMYALPTPPDAVNIIKRAKEINYVPKAWGWTRGTAVGYFGQALKKDSDYVFATFAWHPEVKRPGSLELAARCRKALGHEPFLAGIYYANVQIARAGIEKAGSLDKQKIRDEIKKLDIDTTAGKMAFTPDGRWKYSQKHTMLFQWQNEKLEIVWPEDQKTASMWFPTKPWAER